jgi:hypothetical protein
MDTKYVYQMAVKRPNVNKIYQYLPFQGPQNYTQIRIFGLKKCHLATLPQTEVSHAGAPIIFAL